MATNTYTKGRERERDPLSPPVRGLRLRSHRRCCWARIRRAWASPVTGSIRFLGSAKHHARCAWLRSMVSWRDWLKSCDENSHKDVFYVFSDNNETKYRCTRFLMLKAVLFVFPNSLKYDSGGYCFFLYLTKTPLMQKWLWILIFLFRVHYVPILKLIRF